jgi:chaperonin GroES
MSMNFKPIDDRILVNEDERETKTSAGFFIPETNADAANRGTILAVGPGKAPKQGRDIIPVNLKVGERVLYAPGSGHKVVVAGKSYLVLKEDEVLALVDDE